MTDYYAIKVMYPAESIEVAERIEWCKENDVYFFTKALFGCSIADTFYTTEEMKEIGTLVIQGGEFDLDKMIPVNIGTVFAFSNEEDVMGFKLAWS